MDGILLRAPLPLLFLLTAAVFLLLLILISLRAIYVLKVEVGRARPKCKLNQPYKQREQQHLSTLIVLGSGGHTAEILNLMGALDSSRYRPRVYIAAMTDKMSLVRARTFEESRTPSSSAGGGAGKGDNCFPRVEEEQPKYMQVYRSREVGQSYVTSVFTTLLAMAHSVWLVVRARPDLILCNGPGTCLPICVAGMLLRVLGIKQTRTVYVESVARVKKLSLTGHILYRLGFADQFYVQWPQLTKEFPRSLYVGRLM